MGAVTLEFGRLLGADSPTGYRSASRIAASLGEIALLCSCSAPPSEADVKAHVGKTVPDPAEIKDFRLLDVKKNEGQCNTFLTGDRPTYVVIAEYTRDLGDCSKMKAPTPRLNCGAFPYKRAYCFVDYGGRLEANPA